MENYKHCIQLQAIRVFFLLFFLGGGGGSAWFLNRTLIYWRHQRWWHFKKNGLTIHPTFTFHEKRFALITFRSVKHGSVILITHSNWVDLQSLHKTAVQGNHTTTNTEKVPTLQHQSSSFFFSICITNTIQSCAAEHVFGVWLEIYLN